MRFVLSCIYNMVWRQICIEKCSWECSSCPLSGIEKRPFLGGCLSTITIVISFRNKECVRCREVVRFSEGPLSEVRLYASGQVFTEWSLHVHACMHACFPILSTTSDAMHGTFFCLNCNLCIYSCTTDGSVTLILHGSMRMAGTLIVGTNINIIAWLYKSQTMLYIEIHCFSGSDSGWYLTIIYTFKCY